MAHQKRTRLQVLPSFLLCILSATLLWLLTMLGRDYSTEISVPIKFTNFPADRVANSELPASISVGVNGRGFTLLKLQAGIKREKIELDVNKLISGKNCNLVHINQQELRERIGAYMSAPLSITAIHPESINVSLAEVAQKRVPVKINHNVTFKKQFTLKGEISAEPSHIVITGAKETIDSISFIETELLKGESINSNIERDVKLINTPHVTYNDNAVVVKAIVEQTTGAEKSVNLRILNLPKSSSLTLFPDNITVTYEVGLSKYQTSLKEEFDFVVDFNDTYNNDKFLEIKLNKAPDYVENLTYSPHRVEYIIEER